MFNQVKKNRGYTLLFAVLVSALVLGVGVSILNIARKELVLSSGARESQYAFYAAITGYECGIYWDGQGSFATTTPSGGTVTCGTNSTGVATANSTFSKTGPGGASGKQYSFIFSVPLTASSPTSSGQACADVTVTKDVDSRGVITSVTSNGYNIGWVSTGGSTGNCAGTSPVKVQRTLYTSY